MIRYSLLGRQREGTSIIGYILNDNVNNQIVTVTKNKAYELAFNKMIKDVTIQYYNGKIIMKGIGFKVSELPDYDLKGNLIVKNEPVVRETKKVLLTGKYFDGKNIAGYKITVVLGNTILQEYMASREKVMELAAKGLITNARYQKSNGVGILRGVDCKLSQLPLIEVAMNKA